MRASTQQLAREVAVYKGEVLLAEGTLEEVSEELKIKPTTILFYLTPAYERRLAKRKTIDNSRTAIRLDDGEDEFKL